MAHAICTQCGREVSWRARRGARLADQRCDVCGGGLRGKSAGQASANRGRKAERCVVCGRRRFKGLMHPPGPWQQRWHGPNPAIYETGRPVCSWHEPVPAGKPTAWPWYRADGTIDDADAAEYARWKEAAWGIMQAAEAAGGE